MSNYVRSYTGEEFKQAAISGKIVVPVRPSHAHLHWMLVRGRPRWVLATRRSWLCNTSCCGLIEIRDVLDK